MGNQTIGIVLPFWFFSKPSNTPSRAKPATQSCFFAMADVMMGSKPASLTVLADSRISSARRLPCCTTRLKNTRLFVANQCWERFLPVLAAHGLPHRIGVRWCSFQSPKLLGLYHHTAAHFDGTGHANVRAHHFDIHAKPQQLRR